MVSLVWTAHRQCVTLSKCTTLALYMHHDFHSKCMSGLCQSWKNLQEIITAMHMTNFKIQLNE